MASPSNAIMEGMKKLYGDTTMSDFVLAAGGQEWKVHKFVLLFHSDVLYKMASSEEFIECKTGRAELKDADPTHVHALVHYLYNCDYGAPSEGVAYKDFLNGVEYDFHLDISVLADMYNIQGLAQLAANNVGDYFEKFQKWEPGLATLVEKAYEKEGVPGVVKEALAKQAAKDMRCLHSPEGEELLRRRPEFAIECALACAERASDHRRGEFIPRPINWSGSRVPSEEMESLYGSFFGL